MDVVEAGKGGVARVKQILEEQFSDGIAVAMFRVTAVDDRENTVSYRTKLVHVIYIGSNTPVMKRAKVASYNSALKQPFTSNLSIQTDDITDLAEKQLEKSLRASGGAHQPTRFDFTNNSAPGAGAEARVVRSTSAHLSTSASPVPASSSPSVSRESPAVVYSTTEEVSERCFEALKKLDADGIVREHAENAILVESNFSTKETESFTGIKDIKSYFADYAMLFMGDESDFQVLPGSFVAGNVSSKVFSCPDRDAVYAVQTVVVENGKIVFHSLARLGNAENGSAAVSIVAPVPVPASASEDKMEEEAVVAEDAAVDAEAEAEAEPEPEVEAEVESEAADAEPEVEVEVESEAAEAADAEPEAEGEFVAADA